MQIKVGRPVEETHTTVTNASNVKKSLDATGRRSRA